MKISVALAAYKGEKYIEEQMESILCQLGENDELIVSDDFPEGETRGIVEEFALRDGRVKYLENQRKGVVNNFENALSACSGDIIFLCDQDDVWMPDKVESVMKEFENGAQLVLHDACVTDGSLNVTNPSCFAIHGANLSFVRNLVRNTFVGCCMAFTKELLAETMPFPDGIAMHDWWIALVALKKKRKTVLLEKPLILWRRHGNNVTGGKTAAMQKIHWRVKMISELMKI